VELNLHVDQVAVVGEGNRVQLAGQAASRGDGYDAGRGVAGLVSLGSTAALLRVCSRPPPGGGGEVETERRGRRRHLLVVVSVIPSLACHLSASSTAWQLQLGVQVARRSSPAPPSRCIASCRLPPARWHGEEGAGGLQALVLQRHLLVHSRVISKCCFCPPGGSRLAPGGPWRLQLAAGSQGTASRPHALESWAGDLSDWSSQEEILFVAFLMVQNGATGLSTLLYSRRICTGR
jgi:hypothetical protein